MVIITAAHNTSAPIPTLAMNLANRIHKLRFRRQGRRIGRQDHPIGSWILSGGRTEDDPGAGDRASTAHPVFGKKYGFVRGSSWGRPLTTCVMPHAANRMPTMTESSCMIQVIFFVS